MKGYKAYFKIISKLSDQSEEWYNVSNRWLFVSLNLIPNNLERKNHINTCIKQMVSKASTEDYNNFVEYLCIGTVNEYVEIKKPSKNSIKELATALDILANTYTVTKTWADYFLNRINLNNKDLLKNRDRLIKNAI